MVLSGYSGFFHHYNWSPWYSWTIVESVVKTQKSIKNTQFLLLLKLSNFLLTKSKPEYPDILYNPIYFSGPLCRIRPVYLYMFAVLRRNSFIDCWNFLLFIFLPSTYFHLTQSHNKHQIHLEYSYKEKFDRHHSRHIRHCSLGVKLQNEMNNNNTMFCYVKMP